MSITIQVCSDVWYVDPGSGTNEYTAGRTEDNPFDTIQYAVNRANSGDTIRLLDDADIEDMINIYEDNLTFEGFSSGSQKSVDLDGDSRLFKCDISYYDLTFRDINFNSGGSEYNGGAIYHEGYLTLYDCSFYGCDSESMGGAVYCGSLSASNCSFRNCSAAGDGGAVYAELGVNIITSSFDNCISCDGRGGAVYFEDDATFSECSFTSNESEEGGGALYSYAGDLNVLNCYFEDNDNPSQEGAAIYRGGSFFDNELRISDSLFLDSSGDSTIYVEPGRCLNIIERCRFIDEDTDSVIKLVPSSAEFTFLRNTYIDNADIGIHFIYPDSEDVEDVKIQHCTINDAYRGIQIDGASPPAEQFNIVNSIIWECSKAFDGYISTVCVWNSDIDDLDDYDVDSKTGCIDEDPDLENDGQLGQDSPCIDVGTIDERLGILSNDCAKIERPRGHGYDMGAFESDYYASLACSKDLISKSCVVGSKKNTGFDVENVGGGWMNYAVSVNASWLKVDPAVGIIEGNEDAEIDVDLDASNLDVGTYNAVITVSASRGGYNASGSPIEIPVTFRVYAQTATVTDVSVSGPTMVIECTETQYTAVATYSDGSTTDVTATAFWNVTSQYASISSSGILTAYEVPADTACRIEATYEGTLGGHTITIKNIEKSPLIYVSDETGNDAYDGLGWETPKKTIQAAIDAVVADGSIIVTNGHYMLSSEIIITQAMTVMSVNGPESTFVDGQGICRGFNLGESTCTIKGFTVTNCYINGDYPHNRGGGIYCLNRTPVITNCIITANKAADYLSYGGGVYGGTLHNCVLASNVIDNDDGYGGGASASELNDCILKGNSSCYGGGAQNSTLLRCVLDGNSGSVGGGAYQCTLMGCTLTGNTARSWGGGTAQSELDNCLVQDNTAVRFGGGTYYGQLTNCTLTGNVAVEYGGAAYGGMNVGERFCILDNCVLNNNAAGYRGGGAHQALVRNCVLIGNSASNAGGGVCWSTVNDCILSNNVAEFGGGAFGGELTDCELFSNEARCGGGASSCKLNNCILAQNSASSTGGGIFEAMANNCVIYGNSAQYIGGASVVLDGELNNCVVSGNSGSGCGGVQCGKIRNCIVWGNEGGDISIDIFNYWEVFFCCLPILKGTGCVTNDPMFVDAANGNFMLQADSPCINAGNDAYAPTNISLYDLAGNPRIAGECVDMGAYEFQSGMVCIQSFAGAHGTVIPEGLVMTNVGSSIPFVFLPETYYEVADVVTNGANMGLKGATEYTWDNIMKDGTLHVEFQAERTDHNTPFPWLAESGFTQNIEQADCGDQDHDGMVTWQEYLSKTDPTNKESVALVQTDVDVGDIEAGNIILTWLSATNLDWSYRILKTEDLVQFTPVVSNIPPTPPVNVYTVTVNNGMSIFKIETDH
jgi:parallel beta-helix repeat protein/predicted outer membrane repeat protein